jgi:formamidopyrimidine-DNA glycosylase
LIIDFSDSSSLIFHFKLTGQLIFNGKPSPSTRKVFYFKDGSRLVFNDTRKFGWWKNVKKSQEIEGQFGPEALAISLSKFRNILARRPNAKIKPLLMDQKFIAGIGNIYSSEILYAAKVHPLRPVKTLNDKEIGQIFRNIGKILRAAIKYQGSSVEYYVDARGEKGDFVEYHKVYQKEDQRCYRCAKAIKRIKIGSRSAYFCPNCQRL